ncbi:RNA-binding domain-containing protein [Azotobacter vinelandii]|uniref:RNA-binding domain-containing protein n=1 Tax=Azotobacter vinelandii TaxID=354 RepID=UPI002665B7A1|nr:RNA-binding domain-containing protein [Azotobacter vinelandii]WKN24058.1 putative DNA binding domain-containing protein [Azotobacter vinelandii]
MSPEHLVELLRGGEGLTVEFKRAREALNRDIYETVCAFLNQRGGTLVLGAADDGRVTGIAPEALAQMRKDLANTLHNSQKINPPMPLVPEQVELDGQTLLVLSVPESSQVHSCNGRIFSRNEDGDFNISGYGQLLAERYLRKQVGYSENRIFPYIRLDDLRGDLIERVRHNVRLQRSGHPWAELDDLELLKSARLYQRDYQTGNEGISMAGALLFGRDEVVLGVVPHHRTDAILRVHDLDRYDDRDDIRTNLLESYDRLMAFVNKHIADPFYLEGNRRVSLRERIFREVVANLLIHREYLNPFHLNPFPAKLIIQYDRVSTENSNNPHGLGLLRPDDFAPSPKNPAIARVFREMQWAEELGSGVRNLFKYARAFGGQDPILREESIFRVTVMLPPVRLTVESPRPEWGAESQAESGAESQEQRLLAALGGGALGKAELASRLGLPAVSGALNRRVRRLLDAGLIEYTLPDKPNSRLQRYRLTDAGRAHLNPQD